MKTTCRLYIKYKKKSEKKEEIIYFLFKKYEREE